MISDSCEREKKKVVFTQRNKGALYSKKRRKMDGEDGKKIGNYSMNQTVTLQLLNR